MLAYNQYEEAREKALKYYEAAGIILTENEKNNIEVADFGLNELAQTGLELVVYVNTERCCAKELVLFPFQTCPQHRHPSINGGTGKEETFRCRWGKVYLYVDGKPAQRPKAKPPVNSAEFYTVWNEIELSPGEQYTLQPDTLHWFQAGPEGAVISEFSTRSADEADIFTDPQIQRLSIIK